MAQGTLGDLEQPLHLSDHDIERRKRFVGFEDSDLIGIAALRPIVVAQVDDLTETFLAFLRGLPEAAKLFERPDVLAEAARLKRAHLIAMVSGVYDSVYVAQRLELGTLYSRVGLDSRVFLGAFQYLIRAIGEAVMRQPGVDPMTAFDHLLSLRKVAFFDIGLIIDVIIFERERTISLQQEAILQLNRDLEQRVRDRTTQLETANADLIAAKEEAEQATQAKSVFLSSMSHELRTPLNAILGFSQLLETEAARTSPEQRSDFVRHINKAGKHLLALINEILDLARIEAGKVALSPEPVALADILDECRAMLEPMASERSIRLIFPAHDGPTVRADRTRLRQILLNLLSNAIKYNRDQGAVVVDCAVSRPTRIRVSIQDTGIGLAADQMQQLFQPFSRLGQEAGPQEGTGIGLMVTKRLVEMMEGSIGVTSNPGVGSIFWIELPVGDPTRHAANGVVQAAALVTDRAQRLPLLLYVEDNPANLKLIEEIIHFRGDLDMISAPDGHLGVALARAHRPSLILMDIHLPGMSGIEAQQILRQDRKTADIPVIALTANAMPREVAKGLAAGFFRYVTKPIDIRELTEAIDSALAMTRPRPGS